MFNLNSARIASLAALMFFISACQPTTAVPSTTIEPVRMPPLTTDSEQPLLKTEMGDFVLVSARLVDEANGAKPLPGEKLLLVILTQPDFTNLDQDEFSLEAFSNMTHDPDIEIYILGEDGSQTISTMGGWIGDEFAMGFRVPAGINTYTLHWTGNSLIALHVEE